MARFSATAGIAAASGAALALSASDALSDPGTTEGRIKATIDAAYLGSLAIQRLLEASIAAFTVPTNPTEAAATIRALEQAAATQHKVDAIRRRLLRLEKENQNADVILPVLPIRQMTNAEVEALRLEQRQFDDRPLFDMNASSGSQVDDAPLDLDEVDDRLAEGCDEL